MGSRFNSRMARLPAALAAMMVAWPAWGAHPCAECHAKEVAGFSATQMGQSLGRPGREPSGKYFHAPSKTQFTIQVNHGQMV